MLPYQARVDVGAMAMKGYSAFPRAQYNWNLTIRLFSVISRTLTEGVLPADWAKYVFDMSIHFCTCTVYVNVFSILSELITNMSVLSFIEFKTDILGSARNIQRLSSSTSGLQLNWTGNS